MADRTSLAPQGPTAGKHGCCADKACTEKTCMALPAGKTCGDCVHIERCAAIYGHTPTDTYCDWFPRRFHARVTSTTNPQPADTSRSKNIGAF